VFDKPAHPYTQGLLDCIPVPGRVKRGQHLGSIPGIVPLLTMDLPGCAFANRCRYAQPECFKGEIPQATLQQEGSYKCLFEPSQRRSSVIAQAK